SDYYDYYKFTTTVDGRLSIDDNASYNLEYSIGIFDSDGLTSFQYATRTYNNGGYRIVVNLSPGKYYIKFHKNSGEDGTYTVNPRFEAFALSGDDEPNDTYQNADILTINSQNSGNLGSRRDGKWDNYDYWKITITEDGRLTLKDSKESSLNYTIAIFDEDGSTLIKYTYAEASPATRIAVNLSPGVYYIRLNKTGNEGTYTIYPDFKPVTFPGDIEPNDTYKDADILILNKQNSGNLGSRRDGKWDLYDYWKIIIPEDGRLYIKDSTEVPLGYSISIYDKDGTTQIKYVIRDKYNFGSRIAVNLSPGVYYVKLRKLGYNYLTYGSYTIYTDFKPVSFPGDIEPNDTYKNADVLELNKQNSGNLGSRRDGKWDNYDYWKIIIPEDGRLTLKDSTESSLGYSIAIYDENGTTQIKYVNRPKDNKGTRVAVNLSPGVYHVRLYIAGINYSTYGTYTIFTDFKPVTFPGDVEPNDTFENADVLELNKQNSGNLGSRRDGKWDNYDFWKITIPEDGRLTLKDSTESSLGYSIAIYDENGTTQIKYVNRTKDNKGTRVAVNLSPGVYHVRLYIAGINFSTYGTYTIFTDFKPVTFPGDIEPNDTYENADVLELNKQNSGNLGSRRNGKWDNYDYWKITIPEDGRLTLKDSTESTLGYSIAIYKENGTTQIKYVTRPSDNTGNRIAVNLSPGVYYIKLYIAGINYSTYGTYTIFPETYTKLGISDIDKSNMYNIYPNPVQGTLYI
ncbi:MAG: hypothetical protein KAH32_08585, partial [Chlamydiia bacterium]|nr:hypothetical protein [Chlamydiia bacterium]